MLAQPRSTDDLKFFEPRAEIARERNRLPHWDQPGGVYFVTFRLGDSIPQERLREGRDEIAPAAPESSHEKESKHRRLAERIEAALDDGAGCCALRDPDSRTVVADALAHFDGERHWQHAWVILPNHVHALFPTVGEHTHAQLLQGWKSFTAHRLESPTRGTGSFWMKDYFDRLVRDADHFWRCTRYIRRNPAKARLAPDDYTLFEAPFVREQLDAEGLPRSGGVPAAESLAPAARPSGGGDAAAPR